MLYQLINVDEHEQFITLKLWLHMVLIYRVAQKSKPLSGIIIKSY